MSRKLTWVFVLVLIGSHWFVSEASGQESPQPSIIFQSRNGSSIDLEGFPDRAAVDFSIQLTEGYVSEVRLDQLSLYEDGHSIPLNGSTVTPSVEPMFFSILFDYAPEQGAVAPSWDYLHDLAIAISNEEQLSDMMPQESDLQDVWLFCSTVGASNCLERTGASTKLPYPSIQRELFQTVDDVPPIPLAVRIREALSHDKADGRRSIIVIVKLRPLAEIPYIPDSLITELLLSEIPVVLINMTESNDSEEFQIDLRSRIRRFGSHYYGSGGELYWGYQMTQDLAHYRPIRFKLTYPSRLFRDSATHTVLLGYKNGDVESWNSTDFRFLVEGNGEAAAGSVSMLNPLIRLFDVPLSIALFVFLVSLLIWSVENPDENNDAALPSENASRAAGNVEISGAGNNVTQPETDGSGASLHPSA